MTLSNAFLWASATPVVINLDSSLTLLYISGQDHCIRCDNFRHHFCIQSALYCSALTSAHMAFTLDLVLQVCFASPFYTQIHPQSSATAQVKWIWWNPCSIALCILHILSTIPHHRTQIFVSFVSLLLSLLLHRHLSNSHQYKSAKLLVHSLSRNNANMDLPEWCDYLCIARH